MWGLIAGILVVAAIVIYMIQQIMGALEAGKSSGARKRSGKGYGTQTHWEDEDGNLHEREWIVTDYAADPDKKAPRWAALPGVGECYVAGLLHRFDDFMSFHEQANPATAKGSIEWDNSHEAPAIKVFGHVDATAPGVHIGYVPAEVSEKIRKTYRRDMPLGARIKKIGLHRRYRENTKKRAFATIVLVGPGKKTRDTFRLDAETPEQTSGL